jgi:hypothetical protein
VCDPNNREGIICETDEKKLYDYLSRILVAPNIGYYQSNFASNKPNIKKYKDGKLVLTQPVFEKVNRFSFD